MQAAIDDTIVGKERQALPLGWNLVPISSVARLRSEKANPREHGVLPFVGMDDIEADGLTVMRTRPFSEMKSAGNRFYRGDLLYGRLRPYLNKTAVVQSEGACSGELLVIDPSPAIDVRYLQYFMHSRRFVSWVSSVTSGDRPRISFDTAASFEIPLAPLSEQKRIVARIDSMFAEIDEGAAALAQARQSLETFRRALLKSAVTGELTAGWRVASAFGDKAEAQLKRVAATRAHVSARTRSRERETTPILDLDTLPSLPNGWAWATLGQLGEIVGGATVDKKRKPEDPVTVPYLRVANVQRGHIDLEEIKVITVERAMADKLTLKKNDILLNEGGDRDKIGRGWVWDGTIQNMIHQNHVFRVRLFDEDLNPFFISHYANELGRRFFMEEGKQTTNLASISLSKISKLPVPVPPVAEVREIMKRVAVALDNHSEVASVLDCEASDASRLKQSILKSAFEGRLVELDSAANTKMIEPPKVGASLKRGTVRAEGSK